MSAAPSRLGIPFVIAAASGTGKTTVCRQLIQRNREIGGRPIEFSVSHTTRPRRSQEVDGVDYRFVSDDRFQRLVDEDAFLEWATYNENRYGTSWSSIDGRYVEVQSESFRLEGRWASFAGGSPTSMRLS